MTILSKKDVIITVLLGLLYSILYDYTYAIIIATDFAYDGHRYIETSILNYTVYCILAVLPLLFYKGLVGISAAYSFFAYIFMYVPSLHTLFFQYEKTFLVLSYTFVFVVSMVMFFRTDHASQNTLQKKNNIQFRWLEIVSYFLILIVLLLNFHNIQWVNFFTDRSSLYELREDLEFGGGAIGKYLFCWVRNVFVPVLLVTYVTKRKLIKCSMVFFVYIILYMIDKQKITIVLPFVIVIFYELIKLSPERVYKYFHTFIISCMVLASAFCIFIKDLGEIGYGIAVLFVYRTQCIAGIQTRRYIDFFDFDKHEYTYFSHISIVNKIFGNYPYKESLGYTVSYGGGNSNASFWSMDGIAAGGPLACLLISILFVVIKKELTRHCDSNYLIAYMVIILPTVAYFTNVSLFTSLFTGGIMLLIIIFKYVNIKF